MLPPLREHDEPQIVPELLMAAASRQRIDASIRIAAPPSVLAIVEAAAWCCIGAIACWGSSRLHVELAACHIFGE